MRERQYAVVAETEVTGGESPNDIGGLPPLADFFVRIALLRLFNGGSAGSLRAAGSYVPVSQPRICRHPE